MPILRRHPSDLSEKQWATVLRNNDMLCGHYLKAGRAEEELVFTGLEPRYYPGELTTSLLTLYVLIY